jgi:hypothetical protein
MLLPSRDEVELEAVVASALRLDSKDVVVVAGRL